MQNNNTLKPESFYIESKQFYTFFGQLKSLEPITVVNMLVDNVFKHQIILNDKIVLPIITAFYLFNLPINSWYNDIEFKRLFIDLRALTWSTKCIGQLEVL